MALESITLEPQTLASERKAEQYSMARHTAKPIGIHALAQKRAKRLQI